MGALAEGTAGVLVEGTAGEAVGVLKSRICDGVLRTEPGTVTPEMCMSVKFLGREAKEMLTVTVVLVDRTSVDARARSEHEDGESGELGVHHAEWLRGW